jgi:PGF-pre-PGF domain-containing protein
LAFVNLTHDSTITWSKNNVNKSNITSVVGLGIGGASNGGLAGGNIQSLIYTSSCDSVPVTFANNSVIYPFNRSSACRTESENRTVKITVTDSAGNSNSTVLGFTVDNVAPIITVHDPTPGFSTTGKIEVNVSAYDGESQIEWIRYYLDGNSVSFNHTQNGSAITPSFGQNTSTIRGGEINKTINFTAGTHRLKISVNDTLGNVRNSSEITFTYNGPLNFLTVNQSLTAYAPSNYTNISIYNSSGGLISDSSTPRSVDETYQLFLALNKSTESSPINVTINFNGSAANWDALNFSIEFNESSLASWEGIQNNFTAKIVDLITFNGSFDDFLTDSNSYYGFIDFDINVTNITGGGAQPLGSVYELWYFEDESTWTSKVNITECAVNKAITHSTSSGNNFPCWNNTLNKTVRVYVPHFSAIALVNNSRPPTVTRNTPGTLQEIGGFIPNITVSFDTVSCQYILNGTDSSASSNISSRVTAGLVNSVNYCTWDEIYFKNGIYNITYNATDSNGNVNLTNGTTFTMLDGTASNSGTSIDESSIETTTATVLISGVNESVNATVWYGTTVSALTYSKIQTAFSASPSVSLTGLSASTMYHYNVTLRDYNGNPVRNGTFNFTTGAAATTTSDDSSSSSGGGGGATTTATSTVAESKAQVWSSVPTGSSISLNVDKAGIAITSVAVNDVKSELKNVDLEVASLTANPVSADAAAKVYQYLRITKKNIADTDAGSFKIGFRVTKAWLTENGLASGDVSLYRYKSGWNELTTRVAGTDSTYVNYEADTPGFSSFAVGVKSGAEVVDDVSDEVTDDVPGEVAAPDEVEAPKAIEGPGKAPVAWIIAAVVIILGIILLVAFQKKKQ